MYNHTRLAKNGLSRKHLRLQETDLFATTTKFTYKREPCTLFTFANAIVQYLSSIGHRGRAGTSSPRASPSRTWEGGRSMRRCGSGAGKIG
jgi:hypothetical protein